MKMIMVNPVQIAYNKTLKDEQKGTYQIHRKQLNPQNFMLELRIYNDYEEAFFYKKVNIFSFEDVVNRVHGKKR